ncbi:MAG: helix-turn-helix domain-containing protein [Candidatus Binataceae bacterium]
MIAKSARLGAIKSPCSSAAELVARAFAFGIDCLFWRWWPQWRDSLIIVQPETVLRWRRDGWSALWRYRWRGGRPRISSEVRHLIIRMARENFRWCAPRVHGELLMLGFSVSQATVSRYMPARSRRPKQSWRTFLRNQAIAFGHCEYSEEWQSVNTGPQSQSYSAQLERSGATQIATVWVGRKRSFGRAHSTLSNRRIRLRSAECDRGVTHRAAYVSSGSRRALCNRRGAAFLIRSPPR